MMKNLEFTLTAESPSIFISSADNFRARNLRNKSSCRKERSQLRDESVHIGMFMTICYNNAIFLYFHLSLPPSVLYFILFLYETILMQKCDYSTRVWKYLVNTQKVHVKSAVQFMNFPLSHSLGITLVNAFVIYVCTKNIIARQ